MNLTFECSYSRVSSLFGYVHSLYPSVQKVRRASCRLSNVIIGYGLGDGSVGSLKAFPRQPHRTHWGASFFVSRVSFLARIWVGGRPIIGFHHGTWLWVELVGFRKRMVSLTLKGHMLSWLPHPKYLFKVHFKHDYVFYLLWLYYKEVYFFLRCSIWHSTNPIWCNGVELLNMILPKLIPSRWVL